MLNHIVLMGRLTKDPELKTTPSGVSVCNFSLASDRDFKDKATGEKETDFVDCVAWRGTADFLSKYASKGKLLVVSGRLQTRKYTDKNGNNRTSVEVQAENVYFTDSKKADSAAAQTPQDFPELPDDGPLPF